MPLELFWLDRVSPYQWISATIFLVGRRSSEPAQLRLSGRSEQRLVTLLRLPVARFSFLQSTSLFSQAALQITNSFFELYRHADSCRRSFNLRLSIFCRSRKK